MEKSSSRVRLRGELKGIYIGDLVRHKKDFRAGQVIDIHPDSLVALVRGGGGVEWSAHWSELKAVSTTKEGLHNRAMAI